MLVGFMSAIAPPAYGVTGIPYPVTGGNIYFDKAERAIVGCDKTVTAADIPSAIDGTPVTGIWEEAFSGCSNLTSVTIPDSVTYLTHNTFSGTALYDDEANWENGILYIDNVLIVAKNDFSGNCVIKDGTRVIAGTAFFNRSGLTGVTIPNSVTHIGGHAFSACTNLASVTIGNSVTSIGNGAFSGCTSLTDITIPNSVTTIGKFAFLDSGLTSIDIPNSVTNIGDDAFYGCDSLTSVKIPNNATRIWERAFNGCHSLPSITIPNSVTSIGNGAFRECSSLTSVTIPASVTSIEEIAFAGCDKLKDVHYGGTEEQWKAITIGDVNDPLKNATIHYSGDSGDDTPTEYAVTTAAAQNGTVTVRPENAKAGETVTVTPKPDDGYETDAVTVTDKDGKKVSVTKNSDGSYSFTMPEGDVGVSVTFKEKAPEETYNPFIDVNKGAYYYDAVLWAVENNITTGTSATTFSPNATCTRGQVVTFLWRAAGCPEPTGSSSPFTDVKPGDYFYKAVLWAVEKNITKGTGATTFSPNDGCTRGQVVTFLHRFENAPSVGSASNPFTDVSSGAYYNDAVLWAVKNNITTGTGAGKFSPDDVCTRGQIVTFLYRDMGEK